MPCLRNSFSQTKREDGARHFGSSPQFNIRKAEGQGAHEFKSSLGYMAKPCQTKVGVELGDVDVGELLTMQARGPEFIRSPELTQTQTG